MKSKLFVFFFILLLINVSVAQKVIYVDVKTPLLQKAELTVPKAGTIFFIEQSREFGLREAGEDYSLWLMDYQANQEGNRVTIRLKVELRTPAMFRQGKILAQKDIQIEYKTDVDLPAEEAGIFKHFKSRVKKIKSELMLEGFYSGKACFEALKDMVNDI